MIYINPKLFKIKIPIEIVKTDPRVVIIIMFPANLEFAPITSAITKLAIAVGAANTMNIIPRSIFLYPKKYAPDVKIIGSRTILIIDELKAKLEAFLRFVRLKEPPIPINASGSAKSARKFPVESTS